MSLGTRTKPLISVLTPARPPEREAANGWNPTASRWAPVVVLVLLCGALFFYGLNIGELYRTEALRAIIAQEFLDSGDWLVPRLYGEPLLTKPPGMYAAIAAVSAAAGHVTDWTARLPSALAATTLVLLFYWYVNRQLGRLAGLTVAAVVPCGLLWLDKATAAEIDMLQVAWTGAALLFFFRAVEECEKQEDKETGRQGDKETASNADLDSREVERRFFPLVSMSPCLLVFFFMQLSLLCVAGGVLTKWTAPVFFYAAVVPFLLWRRQFRVLLSWQHLLSAFIGAGVCVAWFGAVVAQVGWDVLWDTVWQEAAPRVLHHEHVQASHVQMLETVRHPFLLLLVNLPWSAFALFTLWPGFLRLWDERGRRLVQAFHCWAWPNLIVWTILPDHATRHAFPLFPGLVALGAMVWIAFLTRKLPEPWRRWHVRLALAGLGGFVCAAGGIAVFGVVKLPTAAWWLVVLVLLMAGWVMWEAMRAWRANRLGWLLACCVLTWVVLRFAFVHLYIPVRNHGREPREKAAVLAEHVPAGETLYLFLAKDEGIMFYYGRPVLRLASWRDLPEREMPVYCIVTEAEWRQLQKSSGWEFRSEVHLRDEQGDPMVLLGLTRSEPQIQNAGTNDGRQRSRPAARRQSVQRERADGQCASVA